MLSKNCPICRHGSAFRRGIPDSSDPGSSPDSRVLGNDSKNARQGESSGFSLSNGEPDILPVSLWQAGRLPRHACPGLSLCRRCTLILSPSRILPTHPRPLRMLQDSMTLRPRIPFGAPGIPASKDRSGQSPSANRRWPGTQPA